MMRQPKGGFLGGAALFRSLTLSPMQAALQQAHQMARRHLEAGGAAAPARKHTGQDAGGEFVLPQGIDPLQVALAIAVRLHGRKAPVAGLGNDGLMALARDPNGAVVVLPDYVRRLGAGDDGRGRQVLQQIVTGIHGRRNPDLRQLGSPPSAVGAAPPDRRL
jgi:hypothetical protein